MSNVTGNKPDKQKFMEARAAERNPETEEDAPWTAMTLGDLYDMPQRDVPWLADCLLKYNGISIISGSPKAGKSTAVRCLAAAVGGERSTWLGQGVEEGKVLHLSLEESMDTVRDHYKKLNASRENIVVIKNPWPTPDNPEIVLQSLITAIEPVLVIIDPLAKCVRMRDSDKYSEVSAALEPYIALARNFKTHIMLVHHNNKGLREDGNEVMGSQAMTGGVDTIISMRNRSDVRSFKAWGRDDVLIPETVLSLNDGWIDVAGLSASIKAHDIQEDIKTLLSVTGEMSTNKLLDKLDGDRSRNSKILREMSDNGTVITRNEGRAKFYSMEY